MINYLIKGKISHRDFLLIYQAVQFRPYRTFSSEPATRKGDSFSLNISILKYKWRLFCWRDLTLLVQIPFHGAQTTKMCPWVARGSARGLPGVGRWSFELIGVLHCSGFSWFTNKTKNEQLTFSWVLYFTLFVSYSLFSVLFPMRVFISVCLFCKSNKYIDNCINVIHEK